MCVKVTSIQQQVHSVKLGVRLAFPLCTATAASADASKRASFGCVAETLYKDDQDDIKAFSLSLTERRS